MFEACLASVLVFLVSYSILRLNFSFSLVLAALASATAPASTVMTIRQTGAKGDFVDTLLQVVALDDIVALLAYSIAISVSSAATAGKIDIGSILLPLASNIGVLILGGIFGFFMSFLCR